MNLRPVWLFLLGPVLLLGSSYSDAISFEPNQGQSDRDTRFLSRTHGSLVLVRDHGIDLWKSSNSLDVHVELQFEGTNPAADWQSLEPQPGATTYIIGNRPEMWIRDLAHFGRIVRKNLYDGIDLVLYGAGGSLEYDLVLHAGADPARIRLHFSGEEKLSIGANGDLTVALPSGSLVEHRPVLYQVGPGGSRERVDGAWRIIGGHVAAFHVGRRDRAKRLIIDPVIVAATYLAGNNEDRIVAADPRNLVVGTTESAIFPASGPAQHRGTDVFIYNPVTQSTVVFGGAGDTIATCARISGSFAYIGGYTNSRDFPVTKISNGYGYAPVAPQIQYGGGDWDGFVLEVENGYVMFATYLGGSGDDRVLGLDMASFYGFVAVGSTNSTDFPVSNAWQSSPGGGLDGFLTVMNGAGYFPMSTYLGGSGDDQATAVNVAPSGTDFYVGGVTASSDWQTPGAWTGARNGPSDAFVLHATANTGWTSIQPAEGSYFGGSGSDSISAIAAMPNGNVAVAGTTSSTDIAFPNAFQPAYGGGPSDAFLGVFSSDLTTLVEGTYLGGSGTEQASAIATNSHDEVLAGGWTNSADFPTIGTPLSKCGAGGDDGFLVHVDSGMNPAYSTCYGGSGSDRITSVLSDGALYDFAGGYTDSPERPGNSAAARPGIVDGFFATITVPVIHAEGVTVGKDLSGALLATLGDPTNYIGTPLTATSGDATQVLIATRPDDPGQASATVASAYDNTYLTRRFLIYCLTGNANIPVALSAPGYPTQTVNVRCVASGLYVNPAPQSGGSLAVLPAALDPATGRPLAYQNPRGGLNPIDIEVVNPSPDIVTFSVTSVYIDSYSNLAQPTAYYSTIAFPYQVNKAGSVTVTFTTSSSFPFTPSNSMQVTPPSPALSVYVPPLARDVVAQISASIGNLQNASPFSVTFTSSDPTKVRLTSSPTVSGQASLTIGNVGTSAFGYVEVLDASGSVTITASAPGVAPVTVPVSFAPLSIGWFLTGGNYPAQQASIVQGQSITQTLVPYVGSIPQAGASGISYWLRAGAQPLGVQLLNSATGVVMDSVSPNSLVVAQPTQAFHYVNVSLSGLAAGTAVYSLKVVSGNASPMWPLFVTVQPAGLSLSASPVGVGLAAGVTVSIGNKPAGTTVPVTLTVSNPSMAVLGPDFATPGEQSVVVSIQYSSASATLQAISGPGQVEITASAPGYQPVTIPVRILTSAFAWNTAVASLPASGTSPQLGPYALDPATRQPFLPESVRPGLSGSLTLQIADPSVATLNQSAIPFSSLQNGQQSVNFTAAHGGTTQVSIVQPPGFTQPAARGTLQLTFASASIAFSASSIAVNGQAALQFSINNWPSGSALPAITLTSSDPTKLLFAASNTSLGSASITVSASNYYPQYTVYMNALAGPADVPVTATGSGVATTTEIIPIGSMGLALEVNGSIAQPFVADTQQPVSMSLATVAVSASGSVSGAVTLRPGLNSAPVTINSSNPAVADVPTSPILNSLTASAPFTLQPLGAGQTTLTVSPLTGYILPPPGSGRSVQVTVNGASFVINNLTLGQDLQTAAPLTVANGAATIPTDVDVTLVSSDPTMVLLSSNASSPGSGTLTVHFAHGTPSTGTVYVQALEKSGKTQIAISASGYQSTTTTVTVVPTTFSVSSIEFPTTLQSPPGTFLLTPVPASTPPVYGNYQFRPGLTGPTISAASSNPAVATISPASATWQAGATQLTFTVQPVSVGSTSITFTPPASYTAPPATSLTVTGGTLNISNPYLVLGVNLQDTVSVYAGQSPVTVTATSSNPALAVVSASPAVAGQASITLTTQAGQASPVYVQALAATGSVTITFSAPGYQNTTGTVSLMQSAVELVAPQSGTITPLSAPISFQAKLIDYNSGNTDTYYSPTLRPGAGPIVVNASLSGTAIGTITPSQFTFNAGQSTQSFTFQPTTPGSALLELSVPSGFTDPVAGRQQLLTVVPASVTFASPLQVGQNLASPTAVILTSSVASAMNVTLTSADPTRLLLANSANPNGAASVTVSIPAGASDSSSFSLIGLGSSGTVSLSVAATGIPNSSAKVTLQPSGFVFSNPQSGGTVGSSLSLQIQAVALDPQTLAPTGALPLRPGIAPVPIVVTDSNTAVFGNPATAAMTPGESQTSLNLTAATAGTTTISIQTPAGFTTPSSGNTINITVR